MTRNPYAKRIGALRYHRDLAMKRARWAKEELGALAKREAAGEWVSRDNRHDRNLRIVVNVAKARAKNRSILMWRRLGRPAA